MDAQDLIAWRKAMGWTQQQAADALGMSRRTYQTLEVGTAEIDILVDHTCEAILRESQSGEPAQQHLDALLLALVGDGIERAAPNQWRAIKPGIGGETNTEIAEECRRAGWLIEAPRRGQIAFHQWVPMTITDSGRQALQDAAARAANYRQANS